MCIFKKPGNFFQKALFLKLLYLQIPPTQKKGGEIKDITCLASLNWVMCIYHL
jgi:hypothetical protein